MKNNLELTFDVNDLTQEQQDLVNVIGISAYKKLVSEYGGSMPLYIPNHTKLLRENRNKEICKRFNGRNTSELSREFGLTARTIQRIVLNGRIVSRKKAGC